AGVLQPPYVLAVAQAAPEGAGPARVGCQAQRLDPHREPGLHELDGQVAGPGHHVDRVAAVGVVAAAGPAGQDLAVQVPAAGGVVARDARVADRLLVGGHVAVDRLGD